MQHPLSHIAALLPCARAPTYRNYTRYFMKVECQHCGYIEHVNAHIGPKLWAFSIAFGLLLLGKAFFFDSWGVFLQVCLCMVLGFIALVVSSDEIASINKLDHYCPECGKRAWRIRL